jgi:hypothetical protein
MLTATAVQHHEKAKREERWMQLAEREKDVGAMTGF